MKPTRRENTAWRQLLPLFLVLLGRGSHFFKEGHLRHVGGVSLQNTRRVRAVREKNGPLRSEHRNMNPILYFRMRNMHVLMSQCSSSFIFWLRHTDFANVKKIKHLLLFILFQKNTFDASVSFLFSYILSHVLILVWHWRGCVWIDLIQN